MLFAAVGIIALSFALEVRADQRVAPRGFADYPLPETCLARAAWGGRCPGCGLTRSFIRLAEGDWRGAAAAHRLGWLLALAVLLQVPYRWYCLSRGDCSAAFLVACRWFGWFLVCLLLANWLLDVVVAPLP